MATRTLAEIIASKPQPDRAKLDATTEEDIRRYKIEDGEDPDADIPDSRVRVVPPHVVRRKLGMSQAEFAKALKIPVETLQEWERNGVRDPAIRSLMAIIYKMPEALKALAA
jgi:putative transcriptional regulator